MLLGGAETQVALAKSGFEKIGIAKLSEVARTLQEGGALGLSRFGHAQKGGNAGAGGTPPGTVGRFGETTEGGGDVEDVALLQARHLRGEEAPRLYIV